MTRLVTLIAATLIVLAAGNACAEAVHRWFDNNGQLHFSDRAPAGRTSDITDITSSSGEGNKRVISGLRKAERRLLGASKRRDKEIMQARRKSVSQYQAEQTRCTKARNRYDLAKRKPGAAKSKSVRRYFDKMRELCN